MRDSRKFMFPVALFTVAKISIPNNLNDGWTEEQIKKMWRHEKYNRLLFSSKREEILPFVTTWINQEGIMWEDKQRKTNSVYYHLYVDYTTITKS